jgi:hypothetical protein
MAPSFQPISIFGCLDLAVAKENRPKKKFGETKNFSSEVSTKSSKMMF